MGDPTKQLNAAVGCVTSVATADGCARALRRLAHLGAAELLRVLEGLQQGAPPPLPCPASPAQLVYHSARHEQAELSCTTHGFREPRAVQFSSCMPRDMIDQ